MSAVVPPGYKQTEVGVIPEDWDIATAAQVCELVVDCKNRTPPVIDGGEFAVVRTPNVRSGKFVRDELRFTDKQSFDEWTARAVPQIGDVLITREAPLGEVCLVPPDVKVCLGQRMMLYRPDPKKADSRFLLYSLMSPGVQTNLLKKIGGSTVGHAKVDDIRYLQVPQPPTKLEQQRIAEALSDADALIEGLGQLITKKLELKQGAMQELLRPKEDWVEVQLGDIATFHKGKGLAKRELDPHGSEPCIHYGELFTEYPETIKQVRSKTNSTTTAFRSQANDVIMPTSDVTPTGLAKASCLLQNNVILGGDILVIRVPCTRLDGSFLSYKIRSSKAKVLSLVTGTTVYHLYATDMARFSFKRPERVEEQKYIVGVLNDMDAEIAGLEVKLDKARRVKEGMMQDLLTGKVRLVWAIP